MFLKNTVYFYFLLALVLLIGCKKVPHYSDVPIIQFNHLYAVPYVDTTANNGVTAVIRRDSVYISIKFQDGDGNIGNDNNHLDSTDYFVKTFKKKDGVYTFLNIDSLLQSNVVNYNGKLPLLSGSYNISGPIDGTITRSISFDYKPNSNPSQPNNALGLNKNDTLRFEIQIRDRANNFSNIVTTTDYILWQHFN